MTERDLGVSPAILCSQRDHIWPVTKQMNTDTSYFLWKKQQCLLLQSATDSGSDTHFLANTKTSAILAESMSGEIKMSLMS